MGRGPLRERGSGERKGERERNNSRYTGKERKPERWVESGR